MKFAILAQMDVGSMLAMRFYLSAFILLCFCPMFAKHARRRKRLQRIDLDNPEEGELLQFAAWKTGLRKNALYADIGGFSCAIIWSGILVPFFMLAAIICPFLAIHHRRLAVAAKKKLPPMPSIRSLDGKIDVVIPSVNMP